MNFVNRQSLADRVFEYLVGQLATRKVKIGERINARQVTEDLSVSRTTVNKALERLVKSKWVKFNGTGRPTKVPWIRFTWGAGAAKCFKR